jgi:hypothetical protein
MGYYIQGPAKCKAQYIVSEYDGEIIAEPKYFNMLPVDKALVCVVDNGAWEAAGYCHNEKEFNMFANPRDRRPRKWLIIDKNKAIELAGYPKAVGVL